MILSNDAKERALKIKLLVLDVDGVLTDGMIYTGEDGELVKPFSARDGLGITIARNAGIESAIITGRSSRHVIIRAGELKIPWVYQGNLDKRSAYIALKEATGLKDEEIAYIGDDLVDLPILIQVGLPAAVADAVAEVKESVCFISDYNGGRGAVREFVEFLLKSQGKWQSIVDGFKNRVKEVEKNELRQ